MSVESVHSRTSKIGILIRAVFTSLIEAIQTTALPDFFQDLPPSLGREKDRDEDEMDDATFKKRKKRDAGLIETLSAQGDLATQYSYGNYNLPLEHFGPPNKRFANRDFNEAHSQDLVDHWSDVGLLFPDKAAVVCAFEVQ